MTDIRLYCGVSEVNWNLHDVAPGEFACVSPVYGRSEHSQRITKVKIPQGTSVLQDSGAFSDSANARLSFKDALKRQEDHAERFGYADQIQYRASYDLLIDEVWTDGNRSKRRWSESAAESAVEETVRAAEYLDSHRNGVACVLSAQGVTPQQYLACTKQVVPFMRDGDVFGLGGWCVVGKWYKLMMPVFQATMDQVIPFLGREGVKRVHIFGVIYAPALAYLLHTAMQHGVEVQTDSAGPNIRPCRGQWGYAEWIDYSYRVPPVEIKGLERKRHVEATRQWLSGFRTTQHVTRLKQQSAQLTLF